MAVQHVDAVIVGGGIMGCATGYYLAKAGVKKCVILEKNSVCSGSTGRCAGGFRQQFPTKPECQLAKESIELMAGLEEELESDFEFRQGGYLVLSYTEDHKKDALEKIEMQQKLGIPVVWKEQREVHTMAPWLNQDEGYIGAAWCPTDGVLNPFKLTFSFAEAFKRLGGELLEHTPVKAIKKDGAGWRVISDDSEWLCTTLICCAGAYSAKIGEMTGHTVKIKPMAREKIVTEPVEFFQPFLCNSPLHTLHFNQTKHGSFLMSCANMSIPQRDDLVNTWRFAEETAEAVRRLVPCLGKVKIVRQWAGYYETTPDSRMFIGDVKGTDNFYIVAGGSGHGLMLSAAAGKAVTEQIFGRQTPEWYPYFSMSRVEE